MNERVKVTSKTPESKRDNSVSQTRKTDFSQSFRSPVDQILSLQRTIGNQAVQRLFKVGGGQRSAVGGQTQAKVKISQPGDIYEQEADRVADAVMRMPEPQVVTKQAGAPSIEPACFDCEVEKLRKEPEEEEELIQPKPLVEHITPVVQRQVEEKEEEEKLL